MIIGSALIAVAWLVSMPLWVSIVGTILGVLLIEFCCLVFITRLFAFSSSHDFKEIAVENTITESKLKNKGNLLLKKQLLR